MNVTIPTNPLAHNLLLTTTHCQNNRNILISDAFKDFHNSSNALFIRIFFVVVCNIKLRSVLLLLEPISYTISAN